MRELGADHERNAEAQVRRLAPADVAVRRGGGVERHHRVPWGAGVVGDDARVPIQRRVDLLDHAVGVEGRFVGMKQRPPLFEPLAAQGGDLPLHRRRVPRPDRAEPLAHHIDERGQGELRVPQQGDVRGFVLVDLRGIVGVVDERLAAPHGLAIEGAGEARPQAQHHVTFLKPAVRGQCGHAAAGAQCERVRLVHGGLAGHRAEDRHRGQFRQGAEFRRGPREQHPGTGPDQRPLCVEQRRHGIFHIARRRLLAHRGWRHIAQAPFRHLGMTGIGGEFHHHRPRRAIAQGVKGAAHHVADLRRIVDRLHALGDASIVRRGGEVRPHMDFAAQHATREHEDGHVVRVCLRQAAHGVLGAGLALHRHHAETLPVAGAAEAVRGHHGTALMAEHHWPDAGLGGAFDERVGGEARHRFDAFALEYLGDVVDAVHGWAERSPCFGSCKLSQRTPGDGRGVGGR